MGSAKDYIFEQAMTRDEIVAADKSGIAAIYRRSHL